MKTQAEILNQIKLVERHDIFGFETSTLIDFLEFDNAKSFMKEGVTKEAWDVHVKKADRESVLACMLEYMPFAWDKANNFRGISAARSICHYKSWLWMLGDHSIDCEDYQFYGKDVLKAICDKYGWDHKQWDDGIRVNDESEL